MIVHTIIAGSNPAGLSWGPVGEWLKPIISRTLVRASCRGSSVVERWAHNPEGAGSIPAQGTGAHAVGGTGEKHELSCLAGSPTGSAFLQHLWRPFCPYRLVGPGHRVFNPKIAGSTPATDALPSSSSGRTRGFDPRNRGSSPREGTLSRRLAAGPEALNLTTVVRIHAGEPPKGDLCAIPTNETLKVHGHLFLVGSRSAGLAPKKVVTRQLCRRYHTER